MLPTPAPPEPNSHQSLNVVNVSIHVRTVRFKPGHLFHAHSQAYTASMTASEVSQSQMPPVAFLERGGKLVLDAPWITKYDVQSLNQRALVLLR